MVASNNRTRRALVTTLTSIPLAAKLHTSAAASGRPSRAGSSTLVAYFSRTGNTRVVAGLIQRATDAKVFEIRALQPYPDEYLATVEQARHERDEGIQPALEALVEDIAIYDTIYLGFPIWGETAPPVIRTFLSKHKLTGKSVIPFITHGGYGLGNSEAVVRQHAPDAHWKTSFFMQADQERKTMNQLDDWMQMALSRPS